MKIKHFTIQQEIDLLNLILHNPDAFELEGNGASRVCFACGSGDLVAAGLLDEDDFYSNRPLIIKVALGVGGENQTNAEVNSYLEYGHSYPLGQIFAFGRYVEIMEYINIREEFRNYDDFCGYNGWCDDEIEDFIDYNGYDEEDFDFVVQGIETAQKLCDIFGYTSDNGQIGLNDDGDWVAYDYGFYANSDDRQVSDVSDCIEYNQDALYNYIETLVQLLEGQYHNMNQMERHWFNWYNNNYGEDSYNDDTDNYDGDDDDGCDCSDE